MSEHDTTIFGKIIRREIPADIVFEDDEIIAFRDIAPSAPVHVLFVPKTPIASLDAATPGHAALLGRLMLAAAAYARREGLAADGYRVVMNCGQDAGQTVFQIHLHLLAGADLGGFGAR
jgi:diadenosine tetraphosphate (Ap4A) HIT family hydrolase